MGTGNQPLKHHASQHAQSQPGQGSNKSSGRYDEANGRKPQLGKGSPPPAQAGNDAEGFSDTLNDAGGPSEGK